MKPHKWAKEIKAWADGAEIQVKNNDRKLCWTDVINPEFQECDGWEYRIKPQPKEPKYLYMYNLLHGKNREVVGQWLYEKPLSDTIESESWEYIGKIKLEQDEWM